jgi:hypothetical protein
MGRVMTDPQSVNFQIEVPGDLPTVYANFLSVWNSPHEFTLDFGVTGLPTPSDEAPGAMNVPTRIVARVKVPPTVVDEMLRALATNVSNREDMLKAFEAQQKQLPPNNPEEPS